MTALTIQLVERFRRKIGDPDTHDASNPPTFSDHELQDIYDEAAGSFETAVLLAFEELIGNAWKFTDYTQNKSQEKKSQIMANLLKARDMQLTKIQKGNQVRIVGMRSVPPPNREYPADETNPDPSWRRIR